ncbi:hypothetical protein ACFZA2_01980 [Microbacterium sp. NPDC007973]|uniref:hypothetical protein n=1 Tax=Microbacterium sp. NPDC007973 TaxID=3364182 RepID=UPI0036EA5387
MSVREGVPLARTRDGAILGVDQRRMRGMIPGLIEARYLLPGDRVVVAEGVEGVVQTMPTPSVVFPGSVHVLTHTDDDAPLQVERALDEHVMVRAAGAFDDRGRR